MAVGDIVRRKAEAAKASGGAIERHRDSLTVSGRPVEYIEGEFSFSERWNLLSPSIRAWATERAGQAINDPLTGTPRQYWWCVIRRSDEPGRTTSTAEYELVMFGKRGLVVAKGKTEQFVPRPEATKWKTTRWDVPIDGSAVRHDHRRAAPPNIAADDDPAATEAIGPGRLTATAQELLGSAHMASMFGNLPAKTQRFLLDPFARSGTKPQDVGLHATRIDSGGQQMEPFCVYLFNRRWFSFCFSTRSLPQGSSDDALDRAPWDLAAWAGPTLVTPPGQVVPYNSAS